jgi:hypothetical protein
MTQKCQSFINKQAEEVFFDEIQKITSLYKAREKCY